MAAVRAVALITILAATGCRGDSSDPPPLTLQTLQDVPLPGPSGRFDYQAVDAAARRLYVAGLGAIRIDVFDLEKLTPAGTLKDRRQLALRKVGDTPDVLAFDPGLGRLYVAAESGVLCVFDVGPADSARRTGQGLVAAGAHTLAVDPYSHRVLFPLENVDGHPVLRVMQ